MKIKISTRNTTILVLFVLAILFMSSIISNIIIDIKFDEYLENQHEDNMVRIKTLIEDYYYGDENNFESLSEKLDDIARVQKLYIQIKSKEGEGLYTSGRNFLNDKKNYKINLRKLIVSHKVSLGEYRQKSYDITIGNDDIVQLYIGYIGIYNNTEEDLIFKSAMNFSLILSGTIVLGIAIIFSFLISKRVSKPIVSITNTANEIQKGNYSIRSNVYTSTKEFYDLAKSINYLAENLHKQESLRKRLTSDLVHEIKTPLTILNNYIDAFIDGIWEVNNEKLYSCQEEVLRLSKMADNLKNVYMLEESKLNLNKSQFDISEFIRKIIDTFKPIYMKKKIKISYFGEQIVFVFMDEDKIKQIIYNLLSNAYRYTDNNGQVTISLEKHKENIVIKVKDNGIGITEEDLEYIFERFYRSDLSRTRETGGAGIGLTIVKTLTEAHNGSISVKSQLGKGSEFILNIPIKT
jgi:signal transduction histidine kinase